MIYYEVKNASGRIIGSNIENCPVLEKFSNNEKESKRIEGVKNIYRESDKGSVRLVITNDKDLCYSNKLAGHILDIYFNLIPEFVRVELSQRQHFDSMAKRFIHNLVKIQLHLKANLEKLASNNAREKGNYDDFKNEVERRVKNNTSSAAEDICQISHRVADLDAQIEGLRVVSGFGENIKPSLIDTNINKALIRLIHPFIRELEKNKIVVNIKIPPALSSQNKVRLDPQLLNVAMWQFFDNTAKYAQPGSEVIFTAELTSKPQTLTCEMTSCQIEQDEIDRIFLERYKGKNAKNVPGDGIGMFVVKRALRLMGASLIVEPNLLTSQTINSRKYCKNKFIFKFSGTI